MKFDIKCKAIELENLAKARYTLRTPGEVFTQ